MTWFWFRQSSPSPSRWQNPWTILWLFLLLVLVLVLITVSRGSELRWAYEEGNISELATFRNRLALSGEWFVPGAGNAVSQLVKLSDIYTNNDRDRTTKDRISDVLVFLQEQWSDRVESVPDAYKEVFKLIVSVAEFDQDIISMLGFYSPQTYLILLQNTAESRPNGGFFWSFWVLKMSQGKIAQLEVLDSYILDYEQQWVSIQWPERLLQYLPHRDIHFVWANKTWFSYVDGDHIKQLYEKVYPGEQVRGVVFLRDDMIAELIPGLKEQLRHRQFTNAATDLIRWANKFGKKELYVDQVSDIITNNKKDLLLGVVEKLPQLIRERMINLYLTDVTFSGGEQWGGLEWWLRREQLTTRFEADHMYIREANTSYNKIDTFVTKYITVSNTDWVYYGGPSDIIDISWLATWDRTIDIRYTLSVPPVYQSYMLELEQQYEIQLWDRERHILALSPTREARWLVHLWDQYEILEVDGDISAGRDFATPIPTSSAWYMVQLWSNNAVANVRIQVRK